MSLRRHRHSEHYVTVTIRPASKSTQAVSITVHQDQDAAGNWLLPTITISRAVPQTSEDVLFMKDLAEALYLACLEFLDMMDFIE